MPLRDEAGVALGTNLLPVIFLCSLVAALAAAPITSYFLSRPGVSRDKGMQQLYASMSCTLGGFYILYAIAFGSGSGTYPSVLIDRDELSTETMVNSLIGLQANTTLKTGTYEVNFVEGADAKELPARAENDVRFGDSELLPLARGVHFSFFLWVGVQSLAAISAIWAKCADIFSTDAALRLYGFIGGGGTLGQLSGSFVARALAQTKYSTAHSSSPPYILVIIASLTMFLASKMSQRLQPIGGAHISSSLKSDLGSSSGLMGRLSESFKMILSSSYLLHLCVFLVLTYCTGSLYYFERSLVVARSVGDSNARTAWFATMNVYSSTIVACIQLTASGRILKILGMPLALSATPVFACLGLLIVLINPSPNSVMAAEVLRKVLTYAIARPAREGLFSVVSTNEKYKAKVFIDTVIQRLGDTVGAGFFQVIEGFFALGPQMVAGVGMIVCGFWVYTAQSLGKRNLVLAHQRGEA